MVLQQKIGVRSVRLALSVLAGSAMLTGFASAQEQPMQRVEVTGSAIKRIAAESALPVQRLSAETIARTGAQNVAELIQALPAMQGFTSEAIAAGTDSGGRASASIHGLGEDYTLVLLNGRRIAPQGSGSAVNLNAIPMSAVERVEILTDGASALYGSDAIGGVINFWLKENFQGANVEATYSQPGESHAGRQQNINLTVGYGDLDTDRFNIIATYRHDERVQLKATDREFAKTAYVPFGLNGTNYIYDRTSAATVPANVAVTFNDPKLPSIGFSPYLKKNGNCPTLNFVSLANTATTQNCAFDFASTIEIVPQSKRDTFFSRGAFKLTEGVQLFAEVSLSRFDLTARIAPNTAPFTIAAGSEMFNTNVLPYLTPAQAASVKTVSGNYRTYDWGTRDSQTITEAQHFVVGAKGDLGAWAFDTGVTWSRNQIDERYVGGYVLNNEFRAMLANRSFDPFAPIGAQSDATKQLIENSIFQGSVRTASTTLKGVDAHASRELFTLPAGKVQVAVGADYRQYRYEQSPSQAAASGKVYNLNTPPAYDLSRDNYGAFFELVVPVVKSLEVTASGRYDVITAVDNGITGKEMGNKENASTYKLSARWQPVQTVLVRGSYGTGFKAPSMLDIGQPLVNAGFTSGSYTCPIPDANLCRPGKSQYNVMSGGNENLAPEKSKQYTVGVRWEPSKNFVIGADLWDVRMRDKVSAISETQIFNNVDLFRDLFTTYTEPATGNTYWAQKSLSVNIGQTHYRGIDWDTTVTQRFGFGKLTSALAGTYLMKADYTLAGTKDQWTSNMNFFGSDNNVAFRHVVRLSTALETGAFTNTLIANYRNGYTDASATVRNLSTNANETLRLHVPSYLTFDWQGRWMITKAASLRAGVKNIADRSPPFSLRSSSGHQVGFDPRYADPLGRTFYLTGAYSF
ncbi:TonB-dependent receptor [Massilia buxea]|uniref:TonB system transporter n=2 Tax=Pseudoduganella buxea TaxID=1949069 RepID=A0A6I3SW62_9BURK|nr:TonB-dependent receptor [Pseudoduganella buxea]GGB85469.1 TonB system transporter [Pseudoduganella buxea]